MAWWTAVPALTALVAHDALRVDATHFLDGVGSNGMALGGCTLAESYPFLASYAGASNPMPYTTAVAMPSTGVLLVLRRAANVHVNFYDASSTSYALGQESDGRVFSYNGTDGLLAPAGVVAYGAYQVLGLVKGATTSALYLNGAYVGNMVANSTVPVSLGGMGDDAGSTYCFDAADRFVAAGIFSGAPTLAEMQALEAALRSELISPPPGTTVIGGLAVLAGAQSLGALNTRVLDAGGVRVRLTAAFVGGGVLEGVVTVNAVPAAKQVRLYDKATGALLAETLSAANGVYAFAALDAGREYFIVSHDNTRTYNAVVSDMLQP